MPRDMTSVGPTKTSPVWTNDYLDRDHLIPGGGKVDAAQFYAADSVVVDVGAAGAAIAATSIPVSPALSGPIPNGTVLDFGTNKFARLTAAAAAGATTLTVAAIPTALVDADKATYPGVKPKALESGRVIGRTIAERDASTPYGPADAADDEVYIVAFDVSDLTRINDVELVRPNTVIKENFLPGWTGIVAGVKTKVRDKYVCIRGSE
jgi:hypothetical protein